MSWFSGISLIVTMVLSASLSSCDTDRVKNEGFAIVVLDSGERVLGDEHIGTYVWGEHRILLTPSGVERWESFVEFDRSQDPPVRKLGRLTAKEFAVTVDGVEMYRGHFWSMMSSRMEPGVLLYDTLGALDGEVWVRFENLDGATQEDPRARPEIAAYFKKRGKLKEGG